MFFKQLFQLIFSIKFTRKKISLIDFKIVSEI